MKNIVLILFLFFSAQFVNGQVHAEKYIDGKLAQKLDNCFRSLTFERNELTLTMTIVAPNGVKVSIDFEVDAAGPDPYNSNATAFDVHSEDGLKTSFVFYHNVKKVYMYDGGTEIYYTGTGLSY